MLKCSDKELRGCKRKSVKVEITERHRAKLLFEMTRLLLSKLQGDRETIRRLVEPHLVPGRQLKAPDAFDDLWEVERGSP